MFIVCAVCIGGQNKIVIHCESVYSMTIMCRMMRAVVVSIPRGMRSMVRSVNVQSRVEGKRSDCEKRFYEWLDARHESQVLKF